MRSPVSMVVRAEVGAPVWIPAHAQWYLDARHRVPEVEAVQFRLRHPHRLRHREAPPRLAAPDVRDGIVTPHTVGRRLAGDFVPLECAHVRETRRLVRPAAFAARQLVKLCLLAAAASAQQRSTPAIAKPVKAILSGGDSARVLSIVPLGSGPGHTVIVRFHPYVSLEDATATRRVAIGVWRYLRPDLARDSVDHVLLQATSGEDVHGGLFDRNVAFVISRRANNRWYFVHEDHPIDDP